MALNNFIKEPGLYPDLSNDDYHNGPGISRSHIMRMKKTPLHYFHEYVNPYYEKPTPTKALIVGSALHCALLEPHLFHQLYYKMDDLKKNTKEGKRRAEELKAENQGKQEISASDYEMIIAINKRIKSNSEIGKLFKGHIEQSLFWTDKETGLLCKVKPDIWHPHMIVDLKSTEDASRHSFQSSAYKYGYHIQAAMMKLAFKAVLDKDINDFLFVSFEKTPPYAMAIDIMSADFIDLGIAEFNYYLALLNTCKTTDSWPDYGIRELTPPNFTKYGDLENV